MDTVTVELLPWCCLLPLTERCKIFFFFGSKAEEQWVPEGTEARKLSER